MKTLDDLSKEDREEYLNSCYCETIEMFLMRKKMYETEMKRLGTYGDPKGKKGISIPGAFVGNMDGAIVGTPWVGCSGSFQFVDEKALKIFKNILYESVFKDKINKINNIGSLTQKDIEEAAKITSEFRENYYKNNKQNDDDFFEEF